MVQDLKAVRELGQHTCVNDMSITAAFVRLPLSGRSTLVLNPVRRSNILVHPPMSHEPFENACLPIQSDTRWTAVPD